MFLFLHSSAQLALFYTIFKRFVGACLYPADIAHSCHKVRKTEYGIMIELEANADKIGNIAQALANVLTSFETQMDEEYFNAQKTLFRQKLCCKLKLPAKLARSV